MIAAIFARKKESPKAEVNEELIRHVVLNCIRSYRKNFGSRYGKLVICSDSRTYWRRGVFPFYKCNRKKDRDASPHNWALIFDALGKIRDEMIEHMPYPTITVDGAEADDIIAVLTKRYAPTEEVLIISSDKDFGQLQRYPGVKQYSPMMSRFISIDDPDLFLKEHIIRGDSGDGVPNFLSPDNVFAIGERQKSINKTRLTEWMKENPALFCSTDTMKRGWERNKLLIDFESIPSDLCDRINFEYDNAQTCSSEKMFEYFIEKGLKNLFNSIHDF